MTTAVELALAKRSRLARIARAEMDAQRQAQAAIREAALQPVAEKGPKGDKPAHEWVGTGLRFEKPDGEWGELVDLRGPRGARSSAGGGAGIGTLIDLPLPVLDTDFMVFQRAGRLYRVTVALMKDVFGEGSTVPADAITTEDGDTLMTEGGDFLVQE